MKAMPPGRLPALTALVLAGAVVASALGGAARAAEPPIALEVDPCVAVARARLEELLALELRVLTESGGPSAPGLTRARVACAGPDALLTVSDRRGGAPAERRLDWSSYPAQGRPRLLALALSEMIARAWASEAAPPAAVARAPAAPPQPPAERPRLQLAALASLERIGRPQETAAGLDLVLGWRPRDWLRAQLGGRASATSFDTSPGAVSARTLSIFAAALAGGGSGRLWVGAGPGVRGGAAWLRGRPGGSDPTGRTLAAAWWGPLLAGTLTIQVSRHLALLATVEGGYVARPVIGEVGPTSTDATVALERTWLGGAAGAAWLF